MTADDLLLVCRAQIRAGSKAWVEELETKALAQILKGGGQIAPFTDGNLNGKQFSRAVRMDAAGVAATCRQALDEVTDEDGAGATGPIASTGLDFSRLNPL